MSNNDYIEKMIAINDFIYADTSTLMDTDFLSLFLEKAAPFLQAAGKKITIPPAVRSELIRHLDSEDDERRVKAERASEILSTYRDLFLVPGGSLDDDEIDQAFADAEVLGTLISNRRGHRQLLIANDRDLTRDAFELNQLQSCQGSRISVCHLDRFGRLQMCSCVAEAMQKQDAEGESSSIESKNRIDDLQCRDTVTTERLDAFSAGESVPAPGETIQRTPEQIKAESVKSAAEDQAVAESETPVHDRRDWWKWLLAFTGGVAVGCYAGMYRNEIAQLFAIPLATV